MMPASILAALMLFSPCAAEPPPSLLLLNSDHQERIDNQNLILQLSGSIFLSRLRHVATGKQSPKKLIKSGLDLIVACESRFEVWVFRSTKFQNATRDF